MTRVMGDVKVRMYFCNVMTEYSAFSTYSNLDLRRLWPVVSTTLFPETQTKVRNVIEDIGHSPVTEECVEDAEALVKSIAHLEQALAAHHKRLAQVITERLSAYPYGNHHFAADHFPEACAVQALTSAEIKTEWNRIRNMARRCFGRTQSTAQDKLALARLNAVEQDILYVLFVEQQYIAPLILKRAEAV
jgi:hypothetical protein